MRFIIIICVFLYSGIVVAQQTEEAPTPLTLEFQDFLKLVKQFHPIAKQADLLVNSAEANVLKARGGFDPKLEASYDGKEFLGTDYFDILNTSLKIPTWYGVEFKAEFDDNDGTFLNPESFIPGDGQLLSAGVSVALGEGFFINKRMATLQKAKVFNRLSIAERQLQINAILTQASLSYFKWDKAYKEFNLSNDFLRNTQIRFDGIRQQVLQGDKAAIDSVEVSINLENRKLELSQAKINLVKAQLELSTYLWGDNNAPVILQDNVAPMTQVENVIDDALKLNNNLSLDFNLEQHPKIVSLQEKINGLEIDKRLKADKLKPKIDAEFSVLSLVGEPVSNFNTSDFKAGVTFSFDLFLRKERGELRVAKYKLQEAELTYQNQLAILNNKILANYRELNAIQEQLQLLSTIATNSETLLQAEERKFALGDSSIFLINSRENKLIDVRLKQIKLQNKLFEIKTKLFNDLAIDADTL